MENKELSQEIELSKEDKKVALETAKKIDTTDPNSILEYGNDVQKKLGDFSTDILKNIKKNDNNEINDLINDLLHDIQHIESSTNPSLIDRAMSLIPYGKKLQKGARKMIAKYEGVESNIDNIVVKIDKKRLHLYQDNELLNQLFSQNLDNLKELKVYIEGAEIRLKELKEEVDTIDGSTIENQYLINDKKNFINRLEKKITDLKTSGAVTLQTLPQIRIIQDNNSTLIEKIQSSINSTIPLWKNQFVIAVSLQRQQNAIEIKNKIDDTTNDILKKNSLALKQNAIETAKANERSTIDISTLKSVNDNLISTLEEIKKIKKGGEQKRKEVDKELQNIKDTLKKGLLEEQN